MDWWVVEALRPEDRREFLSTLRPRTYRRDEVVFHQGDPAEAVHLIVSGHAAARLSSTAGEPVTVSVLGPGECFGELALVGPGRRRSATMVALDKCETLSMTRAQFDQLRSQSPHVDRLLVLLLADRIAKLDEFLLEALYSPADRRVARRLVALCDTYRSDTNQVVIPLTQDALASLAGTTRSTTNQALQHLVKRDILQLRRGRVIVLDEAALVSLAAPTAAYG